MKNDECLIQNNLQPSTTDVTAKTVNILKEQKRQGGFEFVEFEKCVDPIIESATRW